MNKYLLILLVICFSYTYSFNKMPDIVVHKRIKHPDKEGCIKYLEIPNADQIPYEELMRDLKVGESYHGYTYDNNSGYGLSSICHFGGNSLGFKLLKRCKFNKEEWKTISDDIYISIKYFNTNLIAQDFNYSGTNSIYKLNQKIESNEVRYIHPLGSIRLTAGKKRSISNSRIEVVTDSESVKLINSLDNNKTIDFQQALLKYIKRYGPQSSRLGTLITYFQNSKNLQENSESIEKDLIIKMTQESKVSYTEEQINLLERSKILAIWDLPSVAYNHDKFTAYKNEKYKQNFDREYESSSTRNINSIIIGYAVDEDNTTYHWVVDLKDDISVLFNID